MNLGELFLGDDVSDILFVIIGFWKVILVGICTVGVFFYYLYVIAMILSREWTVYSVIPCLEARYEWGSSTPGFLIVFNTNGIEL